MRSVVFIRLAVSAAALSSLSVGVANAQNSYGLRITALNDGVKVSPTTLNPPATAKRRLIRIEWNAYTGAGSAPSGAPATGGETVSGGYQWYTLERSPDDDKFPVSAFDPNVVSCDDSNWDYNTTYEYKLVGVQYGWAWNGTGWDATSTPLTTSIYVTVRRVVATEAQTVDTRVDPRYSTYQLKDFKFGTNKYRGGLFAGYNADGAKVARSYFKFTNLAAPPVSNGPQLWWVGGCRCT